MRRLTKPAAATAAATNAAVVSFSAYTRRDTPRLTLTLLTFVIRQREDYRNRIAGLSID